MEKWLFIILILSCANVGCSRNQKDSQPQEQAKEVPKEVKKTFGFEEISLNTPAIFDSSDADSSFLYFLTEAQRQSSLDKSFPAKKGSLEAPGVSGELSGIGFKSLHWSVRVSAIEDVKMRFAPFTTPANEAEISQKGFSFKFATLHLKNGDADNGQEDWFFRNNKKHNSETPSIGDKVILSGPILKVEYSKRFPANPLIYVWMTRYEIKSTKGDK